MKGLELVSKKKKERKKLFREETTVGAPPVQTFRGIRDC